MENQIDISIIIPLYNGKKYIVQTVESLLPIVHTKEILIIDDGSKDDSLDFCKKELDKYDYVQIFHKENGGIFDARNYGMREAKGSFILFVDQDDLVNAEIVDKSLNECEVESCDIFFWSTERFIEKSYNIKCDVVNSSFIISEKEQINEQIKRLIMNDYTNSLYKVRHVWSGIFNLKFIKQNNIFFKQFVSYDDDYFFLFDTMMNANKIKGIPEVGYFWRYNIESESSIRKFITDYKERRINASNYILAEIKKIDETGELYSMYDEKSKMMLVVSSIINYCMFRNKSILSRINLYKMIKDLQYDNEINLHLSGQENTVNTLIKKNHILLAFIYCDIRSILSFCKRILIKK